MTFRDDDDFCLPGSYLMGTGSVLTGIDACFRLGNVSSFAEISALPRSGEVCVAALDSSRLGLCCVCENASTVVEDAIASMVRFSSSYETRP